MVLAIAADLSKVALMDRALSRPAMTGGTSIFPFCWSILLAAQEHDLSGVLTTFVAGDEEVAALTGSLQSRPRMTGRGQSCLSGVGRQPETSDSWKLLRAPRGGEAGRRRPANRRAGRAAQGGRAVTLLSPGRRPLAVRPATKRDRATSGPAPCRPSRALGLAVYLSAGSGV